MHNDELSNAISKAPKNAKYTSHDIQKQILHVLSVRVKNAIPEEIEVSKYCIIVDEAWDESKREQMSLVLRYVDTSGFIKERFFGLVHLSDTSASTLKDSMYSTLAHYNLGILSTKNLLQRMRDDQWSELIAKTKSFCMLRNINMPNFSAPYSNRRGRARGFQDNFTVENHYQVNLFYAAIDSQLQEISRRFSDDAIELLILSNGLDPRNSVKSFKLSDICKLAKKFYADDFSEAEKRQLEMQLKHYEYNVVRGSDYKNLSTMSELCQWLVKTNKSVTYNLIFRLIVLVLTLPVSTATIERSFSAMNIVKTKLRSKMEDDFLSDALMVYIERKISKNISIDNIITDFEDLKERRIPFS